MAKAKKSKAKKSKAKKTKKPARRAAAASRGQARRTKAKKSKARKAKKAPRKAAKPKAKAQVKAREAAPRKKQTVGEGDYQASRSFLKDEADFVKRHSNEIPAMGKAAEEALEGSEGSELRSAEEEARSHARE